jgi:hypothetical protein
MTWNSIDSEEKYVLISCMVLFIYDLFNSAFSSSDNNGIDW